MTAPKIIYTIRSLLTNSTSTLWPNLLSFLSRLLNKNQPVFPASTLVAFLSLMAARLRLQAHSCHWYKTCRLLLTSLSKNKSLESGWQEPTRPFPSHWTFHLSLPVANPYFTLAHWLPHPSLKSTCLLLSLVLSSFLIAVSSCLQCTFLLFCHCLCFSTQKSFSLCFLLCTSI